MKHLIMILCISISIQTHALNAYISIHARHNAVLSLAKQNGFKPSSRVISAIVAAAQAYHLDALELSAIAIVETGMGKYSQTHKNANGTIDTGLFQINTVNKPKCVEYNLESPEGSSMCAAKLLSTIKKKHADYLGRYHSKTPAKKEKYLRKLASVME
jgi:hypothetical protein